MAETKPAAPKPPPSPFAVHLAAHFVIDRLLFPERPPRDLDMTKPCPWCGEKPPRLS